MLVTFSLFLFKYIEKILLPSESEELVESLSKNYFGQFIST